MYNKSSLILVLICSILCSCVSNSRPKEAPDENLVETKNILVIPPHFELKKPAPQIKVVETKKKSFLTSNKKSDVSKAEQEIINKIQGKSNKSDKIKSKLTTAEKAMIDKVNNLKK